MSGFTNYCKTLFGDRGDRHDGTVALPNNRSLRTNIIQITENESIILHPTNVMCGEILIVNRDSRLSIRSVVTVHRGGTVCVSNGGEITVDQTGLIVCEYGGTVHVDVLSRIRQYQTNKIFYCSV